MNLAHTNEARMTWDTSIAAALGLVLYLQEYPDDKDLRARPWKIYPTRDGRWCVLTEIDGFIRYIPRGIR